jgi:hypothetical protein
LTVAIGDAALALCPLPGRFSPYLNDFAAVLAWRPDLVLSLTERSEMKPFGRCRFSDRFKGPRYPVLPFSNFRLSNTKAGKCQAMAIG